MDDHALRYEDEDDWLNVFKTLSHEQMKQEIRILNAHLPSPWYRVVANAGIVVCLSLSLVAVGVFTVALLTLTLWLLPTMLAAFVICLGAGGALIEAYDTFLDDPIPLAEVRKAIHEKINHRDMEWISPVDARIAGQQKRRQAEERDDETQWIIDKERKRIDAQVPAFDYTRWHGDWKSC